MPIGGDLSVLSSLGILGAGGGLSDEATMQKPAERLSLLSLSDLVGEGQAGESMVGVIIDLTGCCGNPAFRQRAV